MLLDKISEAKTKYLSFVKPRYIELFGKFEPDILFIDKSLINDEIKKLINVEIILVDEIDHIAWHKKSQIENVIEMGKDGSQDVGLVFYENDEDRGDPRKDIFNDVLCDFEIKAYIEQSK
ncbi:TPA: hypothetical protein ACJEU7_002585 [Acinetobacter baumannii]|uniref:hypothetical protein n=1 Tax=Acinetobacter baumannii TaxID=470 RepID=UPI002259A8E5|nr:hypothetical protein [Acinetobacter baumannii]MCX3034073.1 hypothetical protein [Acinetobacter baumannii]